VVVAAGGAGSSVVVFSRDGDARELFITHSGVFAVASSPTMSPSIELREDLVDRIDRLRESDVSREEFIAELVSVYETEGSFMREGYSE
jgi:hypothetical protein